MIPAESLKTIEDLNKLSPEQIKEVYAGIYKNAIDEWFPIMFVYEECPHCKGEAHQYENYKQEYIQVKCFNKSCSFYGKTIDQFYKSDDFYRMAVTWQLGLVIDEK
jgi:hypothetical protein